MANRGDEKVRVHINVVPRSTKNTNGGKENSLYYDYDYDYDYGYGYDYDYDYGYGYDYDYD